MGNENKKVFITPNFRNMYIEENPYKQKQEVVRPNIIEKPEDVKD